jgi:hypothetical protein
MENCGEVSSNGRVTITCELAAGHEGMHSWGTCDADKAFVRGTLRGSYMLCPSGHEMCVEAHAVAACDIATCLTKACAYYKIEYVVSWPRVELSSFELVGAKMS